MSGQHLSGPVHFAERNITLNLFHLSFIIMPNSAPLSLTPRAIIPRQNCKGRLGIPFVAPV
jgi:hypothetical protein